MTKTEIILTILEEGAEVTSKLLHLYGTTSYWENARRSGHLMTGDEHRRRFDWVASFQETQGFYSTLNYLKKEGFIKKQKNDGGTVWKLAEKGLKKARATREKASSVARLYQYAHIEEPTIKVVVFDIPERDSKKRTWLRSALSGMGFCLLQKSVWIGKRKIPKEFFFELQRKKIFSYVHIFAVGKTGTFRNINWKF